MFGTIKIGVCVRVTAGKALNYAVMPGILPRLKDILFSGFSVVTQIIAVICYMVGLLPKNHPCFTAEHRHEYGLMRILVICANGIEFKWKYIDKIIVFGLILAGTAMMWLYFFGLIMFVLASPTLASSMFITTNTGTDVAFLMMDKVFGIPGFFNSCFDTAYNAAHTGQCSKYVAPVVFPTPFHQGLHELFRFFSWSIFFIALTIFIYHVFHFILEVTQTGKVAEHLSDESEGGEKSIPWLPIRFVMAFGLLIPFGMGLNSAQWITLYTAKYSSGFATNAWIKYNTYTGDNPTGETNEQLIAKPTPLDTSSLIKGLFLMRSCMQMHSFRKEFFNKGNRIEGYLVYGSKNQPLITRTYTPPITGIIADNKSYNSEPATLVTKNTSDEFIKTITLTQNANINITLGVYDAAQPDKYKEYPGGVFPTCGSVTIPLNLLTNEGLFISEGYFFAVMNTLFDTERRAVASYPITWDDYYSALLRNYYLASGSLRSDIVMLNPANPATAKTIIDSYFCRPSLGACPNQVDSNFWKGVMEKHFQYAFKVPAFSAYDYLSNTNSNYITIDPNGFFKHLTPMTYSALGQPNPLKLTADIQKYGWGGAGLWYNKIGEKNGAFFAAVTDLPSISKFPMTMEYIKEQRLKTNNKNPSESFCEKFNLKVSGNQPIQLKNENDEFQKEEAEALYNLCKDLYENEAINIGGVTRNATSSNPVERAIGAFFSEFQMMDKARNRDVNPMAQLSAIGRVMVDKAIVGIAASSASYALGGSTLANAKGNDKQAELLGTSSGAMADMTMVIAMLGLTAGFVLYFMLPIMPFVYYIFAVGRWVKTIFEALVGVPLWALAHMRVGGPGLPGSAAIGGYFLLLEIFLRPIVTLFSLVVSFALFTALVYGLNQIFSLMSTNVFGVDAPSATMSAMSVAFARDMIDQFFLSILYIVIVYTIGTACFKLIDLIPDNLLRRWSGAGVESFGASDISDDLVDRWQWELPQRFSSGGHSLQGIVKEAVYSPAAKGFAQRKAQAQREEELEKQREAARMAEKAKNQ